MKHEHRMNFFHVTTCINETKQSNSPPPPHVQSSKLYYPSKIQKALLKFRKIFVKMNIMLINDSQLFINSNDFQLEDINQDVNKN